MHPTGPRWADTHTHCHYCGTRAAIRLSRFAVTTPLSQEPAFTGAGPCLKRGQVQHADGCLVSTRSCTAAPVGVATIVARLVGVRLPPLLWGGASVARHNPIRHALAGGPAVHCQAAATYQAELVVEQRVGLSGRLPKSPPCSIRGLGSSSRCHSGSTAHRDRCHSGSTTRRCPPRCGPPAPLAAAFPCRARARRALGSCHRRHVRSWSVPGRENGCWPCAGRISCHRQTEEQRR